VRGITHARTTFNVGGPLKIHKNRSPENTGRHSSAARFLRLLVKEQV
jgi:hypothetical protein